MDDYVVYLRDNHERAMFASHIPGRLVAGVSGSQRGQNCALAFEIG